MMKQHLYNFTMTNKLEDTIWNDTDRATTFLPTGKGLSGPPIPHSTEFQKVNDNKLNEVDVTDTGASGHERRLKATHQQKGEISSVQISLLD